MKKAVFCLILAFVLLSFSACGSTAPAPSAAPAAAPDPTAAPPAKGHLDANQHGEHQGAGQ